MAHIISETSPTSEWSLMEPTSLTMYMPRPWKQLGAMSLGKTRQLNSSKQRNTLLPVTPEKNKRILRTIDWHILPIVLAIYCLQSLDKTVLSYTSVFGIVRDLNLLGQQYSWSDANVYVAQLIWQPVMAYFLGQVTSREVLRNDGFLLGRHALLHDSFEELWRVEGLAIHSWIFRGFCGSDFHRSRPEVVSRSEQTSRDVA